MLNRMTRRVCRLLGGGDIEAGQALLFVLIALALLMSIPLAIATTTVDQLPQTTRNLNWDAAYEAAQAGLNDYEQHLDASGSYSVCSKTYTTGCATNSAFTGWVQASTTPLEYYSYSPSVETAQGLVSLEVSGKAGSGADAVVRTFAYTVRPASSLDDVYWTNYESLDPTISGLPNCPGYTQGEYFGASPATPGNCTVEFDSNDTLTGPVFSNDAFRICGTPNFQGTIESGDTLDTAAEWGVAVPGYTNGNGCGSPPKEAVKIVNNTPPQSAIPATDITAALKYGCEFTGNVTLALSLSGNTTHISWSGGTLATPANSFCTSPITLAGSGGMTASLIYAAGTVTVSGNMTGALDIMAGQSIIVSNNLQYPSGDIQTGANGEESDSTDALGLIATDWVQLGTTSSPVPNLTVDAAILALNDSMYLPNWASVGYERTLTIFGSIAQNFRGPVATVNGATVVTGYAKDYIYDTSLQTLWPPYFVPPNSAVWSPTSYEECLAGDNQSVLNSPNC
jgi:hypothetical protein